MSPSRLFAPGPHCRDGLWMTFTEWVPEVEPSPEGRSRSHVDDARELGRMLSVSARSACGSTIGKLGGLCEATRRHRASARASCGQSTLSSPPRSPTLGERPGRARDGRLRDRPPDPGAARGRLAAQPAHTSPPRLERLRGHVSRPGPTGTWLAPLAVSGCTERTRAPSARCSKPTAGTMNASWPLPCRSDVYDEIWRLYDRQR